MKNQTMTCGEALVKLAKRGIAWDSVENAIQIALDAAFVTKGKGMKKPNEVKCHAADPNNCRFHHTGKYAKCKDKDLFDVNQFGAYTAADIQSFLQEQMESKGIGIKNLVVKDGPNGAFVVGVEVSDPKATMADALGMTHEDAAKGIVEDFVSDIQGEAVGKNGVDVVDDMWEPVATGGQTGIFRTPESTDVSQQPADDIENAETLAVPGEGGEKAQGEELDDKHGEGSFTETEYDVMDIVSDAIEAMGATYENPEWNQYDDGTLTLSAANWSEEDDNCPGEDDLEQALKKAGYKDASVSYNMDDDLWEITPGEKTGGSAAATGTAGTKTPSKPETDYAKFLPENQSDMATADVVWGTADNISIAFGINATINGCEETESGVYELYVGDCDQSDLGKIAGALEKALGSGWSCQDSSDGIITCTASGAAEGTGASQHGVKLNDDQNEQLYQAVKKSIEADGGSIAHADFVHDGPDGQAFHVFTHENGESDCAAIEDALAMAGFEKPDVQWADDHYEVKVQGVKDVTGASPSESGISSDGIHCKLDQAEVKALNSLAAWTGVDSTWFALTQGENGWCVTDTEEKKLMPFKEGLLNVLEATDADDWKKLGKKDKDSINGLLQKLGEKPVTLATFTGGGEDDGASPKGKGTITGEQADALGKIASVSKMDAWFSLGESDDGKMCVHDLEEDKDISLAQGVGQLMEGVSQSDWDALSDDEKAQVKAACKALNVPAPSFGGSTAAGATAVEGSGSAYAAGSKSASKLVSEAKGTLSDAQSLLVDDDVAQEMVGDLNEGLELLDGFQDSLANAKGKMAKQTFTQMLTAMHAKVDAMTKALAGKTAAAKKELTEKAQQASAAGDKDVEAVYKAMGLGDGKSAVGSIVNAVAGASVAGTSQEESPLNVTGLTGKLNQSLKEAGAIVVSDCFAKSGWNDAKWTAKKTEQDWVNAESELNQALKDVEANPSAVKSALDTYEKAKDAHIKAITALADAGKQVKSALQDQVTSMESGVSMSELQSFKKVFKGQPAGTKIELTNGFLTLQSDGSFTFEAGATKSGGDAPATGTGTEETDFSLETDAAGKTIQFNKGVTHLAKMFFKNNPDKTSYTDSVGNVFEKTVTPGIGGYGVVSLKSSAAPAQPSGPVYTHASPELSDSAALLEHANAVAAWADAETDKDLAEDKFYPTFKLFKAANALKKNPTAETLAAFNAAKEKVAKLNGQQVVAKAVKTTATAGAAESDDPKASPATEKFSAANAHSWNTYCDHMLSANGLKAWGMTKNQMKQALSEMAKNLTNYNFGDTDGILTNSGIKKFIAAKNQVLEAGTAGTGNGTVAPHVSANPGYVHATATKAEKATAAANFLQKQIDNCKDPAMKAKYEKALAALKAKQGMSPDDNPTKPTGGGSGSGASKKGGKKGASASASASTTAAAPATKQSHPNAGALVHYLNSVKKHAGEDGSEAQKLMKAVPGTEKEDAVAALQDAAKQNIELFTHDADGKVVCSDPAKLQAAAKAQLTGASDGAATSAAGPEPTSTHQFIATMLTGKDWKPYTQQQLAAGIAAVEQKHPEFFDKQTGYVTMPYAAQFDKALKQHLESKV